MYIVTFDCSPEKKNRSDPHFLRLATPLVLHEFDFQLGSKPSKEDQGCEAEELFILRSFA